VDYLAELEGNELSLRRVSSIYAKQMGRV